MLSAVRCNEISLLLVGIRHLIIQAWAFPAITQHMTLLIKWNRCWSNLLCQLVQTKSALPFIVWELILWFEHECVVDLTDKINCTMEGMTSWGLVSLVNCASAIYFLFIANDPVSVGLNIWPCTWWAGTSQILKCVQVVFSNYNHGGFIVECLEC